MVDHYLETRLIIGRNAALKSSQNRCSENLLARLLAAEAIFSLSDADILMTLKKASAYSSTVQARNPVRCHLRPIRCPFLGLLNYGLKRKKTMHE
jgi:hypothetical protein